MRKLGNVYRFFDEALHCKTGETIREQLKKDRFYIFRIGKNRILSAKIYWFLTLLLKGNSEELEFDNLYNEVRPVNSSIVFSLPFSSGWLIA